MLPVGAHGFVSLQRNHNTHTHTQCGHAWWVRIFSSAVSTLASQNREVCVCLCVSVCVCVCKQ